MEEKTTNLSTGQQQFNLRWNNHTNNILQVFTEQLNNEALVDVTISCEGQYIKAHKMILSACSPYFQDLFRVHTVSHPLIIINGMKYTDVKQVIDFMYRGEVKVLETDLESILAVAESLQVKGLSTVRNSYEKHDVSHTNDQPINETPTPDQTNTVSSVQQAKKRKLSSNVDESTEFVSDESLSSTIKIEPPEIRDIDQDEEKMETTEPVETRKSSTPKPLKTSKSGRTIRPKSYEYAEPVSIPRKTTPNYTCHGFVDPANKALKIPRPPNAFMIFANEWRKKLATENPKDSNKEISIRLGVMWKSLGPDAKESYYSASRRADEEHKRKYPGYYYSPKEARIRKNLKETLTTNKTKKNCDAMRFIKVVMKDNTDTDVGDRWRPSDEKEDDPDEIISVNVNVDSDEDTRSESALQIDTSPEADSSSPKE